MGSANDLARLASANCTPAWSQTFSYDQWSNITKAGSVNFNPGYNGTGANNHANGFSYDGMGNVTNDGSYTYSYDAEGRPTADAWMQTIYDAFGRAVEISYNGTYTQIVYGPSGQKFAYLSGQSVRNYIVPLVAGVQAVYNGSGLQYYRHADWLGSSRFATTATGAVRYDRAYAPFGETYADTGVAERSFTGQTQDVLAGPTGIYDFLFRQQASSQGRWLVPDPAGLAAVDLTNPQTWNRYAYVGNNPLSNIDPLGLCVIPQGGWCIDVTSTPLDFDIASNYFGGFGGGGGAGNPNRLQMIGDDKGGGGFVGGLSKFQLTNASKASDAVYRFLASCEGYSSTPYNDSRKNCTIGYGQLLHLGPCTSSERSTISTTEPAAMAQFQSDVSSVVTSLNNTLIVPLKQSQFDAMVSLTFNMQMGRLMRHDVWRDVNTGNMAAVPGDIRSLGGGGNGIPARRANEANMFANGAYADNCYE